jgi:PPOX class probable F420-dependent enzyme
MDPTERALLERARRAFLATADGDGRPAVVPVCFALVDGERASDEDGESTPRIVTPLDEKPKDAAPRDLRRVRDVAANPRVALVVDRYDEDWSDLAWAQVRGTAALVAPGEAGHAAAADALWAKYDQYADHRLAERPLLRVTPGHVVSWAATGTPGAPGE